MLSQARLRELFDYDQETGAFVRRVSTSSNARAGDAAGHQGVDGYVHIRIDGKLYLTHRLAWLFVFGRWPLGETDHLDGNRANNRLMNLREATRQQNQANKPRYRNNRSGFKGVSFVNHIGKWRANIRVNGKTVHIGVFATPEAAHAAYVAAAKRAFGEFARGT